MESNISCRHLQLVLYCSYDVKMVKMESVHLGRSGKSERPPNVIRMGANIEKHSHFNNHSFIFHSGFPDFCTEQKRREEKKAFDSYIIQSSLYYILRGKFIISSHSSSAQHLQRPPSVGPSLSALSAPVIPLNNSQVYIATHGTVTCSKFKLSHLFLVLLLLLIRQINLFITKSTQFHIPMLTYLTTKHIFSSFGFKIIDIPDNNMAILVDSKVLGIEGLVHTDVLESRLHNLPNWQPIVAFFRLEMRCIFYKGAWTLFLISIKLQPMLFFSPLSIMRALSLVIPSHIPPCVYMFDRIT